MSVTDERKAAEKKADEERKQQMDNNYVTPLAGTFLNLPKESVEIQCPACGVKDLSEIQTLDKRQQKCCNQFCYGLYLLLCCCFCTDYKHVVEPQEEIHHYCKKCNCYFGRAKRIPRMSKGVHFEYSESEDA